MTTEIRRPRGRPRLFDPDQGVSVAQRLFHARGYDAVSVSDLTEAMGINPPSFYAAFGSKAELFARTLANYTRTEGVPLDEILWPGRPVAEALSAVLEDAARKYTAHPHAGGCLTIESTRSNEPDARVAALNLTSAAREVIYGFVADTRPELAGSLADYTVTIMSGLSSMAREGYGKDRVLSIARVAATAYGVKLEGSPQGEQH